MTIWSRLTIVATVLLLLAAGAGAYSLARPSGGPSTERTSGVSSPASSTESYIARLQQRIEAHLEDIDAYVQLGFAHLQRARETGDTAYYATAETVLQQAVEIDPEHGQTFTAMGALALARHDFQQALDWAERAPMDDADTQAVLGDALLELGRYDEAFEAFQAMADLRPDPAAHSRIAYARELTGDIDGAMEAMRSAADAGAKGESAAWYRLQLGHLYFNTGDLDAAQAEYERALDAFPGYVHAEAAVARVRAARGDLDEAAALYSQVVARYPVAEYVIALGDVYRAAGREEDAAAQYDLVDAIDRLYKANGVNTDLEMALYFVDHDLRLDGALRQARAEYERRPSIHAADTLAWALYKSGRFDEAREYSLEALRLGTQDALMLFHAGMIAREAGDHAEARSYLAQALDINPHFSVLYSAEARTVLGELTALVESED